MHRLSRRALAILTEALNRLNSDALDSIRRDLLLERLQELHQEEGEPLTEAEIRAEVQALLPRFDDAVVRRAARANRQRRWRPAVPGLGLAGKVAVGVAVAAGGLWVLNLPYPMIRWPVARVAPALLLPSYLSMDHHYRQTVSLVEQSDQLVNQATSPADIELGAEKVAAAQHSLDRLPVWFLGYYPRAYCTLFSCTWRFTYDEFAVARAEVGRMEAKIFQETNALTQLEQGTERVEAAQATYTAATTPEARGEALQAWQQGMDQLNEIPLATWAGQQAQTKLVAYGRDFQQVAGAMAGGDRADSVIGAAQGFARRAAEAGQNAPHPVETWQRAEELWVEAIARLEQLPPGDPSYGQAQDLLAEYMTNLGIIRARLAGENRAQAAWLSAQSEYTEFVARASGLDQDQYRFYVQTILNHLENIPQDTTRHSQAQGLRTDLQDRLAQLN